MIDRYGHEVPVGFFEMGYHIGLREGYARTHERNPWWGEGLTPLAPEGHHGTGWLTRDDRTAYIVRYRPFGLADVEIDGFTVTMDPSELWCDCMCG